MRIADQLWREEVRELGILDFEESYGPRIYVESDSAGTLCRLNLTGLPLVARVQRRFSS
jgi:hypothetical protein